MPTRYTSALITIGAAIVLLLLTWPQLVGAQNFWVIAHIVSLRGAAVVAAAAALVLLLLLTRIPALRRVTGMLAVVVLLFIVANAGILAVRGIGPYKGAAAAGGDAVTVLSWNTLGDAPGAAEIARLALAQHANVITLAETTETTGVAVAKAMRAAGRPMWVHTVAFDHVSKARSTTLLISPDLGRYEVASTAGSGPPGNTNVLPTVVAKPVDGTGPTVIAVHAASGDLVEIGQTILTVEAMKMEHKLVAATAGVVSVTFKPGDLVKLDQIVATIASSEVVATDVAAPADGATS